MALLIQALIRLKMADADGAFSDYTNAIKYDPESKKAYYNRGVLNFEQGSYQAAIEDYDKAIELDPSDVGSSIIEETLKAP